MGIKISFTKGDKKEDNEISFGLSDKNKRYLKSIAKKTADAVVDSANRAVKKVDNFIDELIENEIDDIAGIADNIMMRAKGKLFSDYMEPDEEERKKKALEEKIRMIPEGKTFTLEEYLDYTDEVDWDAYKNLSISKKVEAFWQSIRYEAGPLSACAFEEALNLENVSYSSLLPKIQEICKAINDDEEEIIESLKNGFNNWYLSEREDVCKYCPNESLMNLIRYFKKKVNESEERVKEKINQIPEGKIFTLAEYLDYTEEFKCDNSKNEYNIAEEFLDMINFPCTEITTAVFIQMLILDKPTYKKINEELLCGRGESAIESVKTDFGVWLALRPDIKKYCPKASLWQLLTYFRNKVNEAQKN